MIVCMVNKMHYSFIFENKLLYVTEYGKNWNKGCVINFEFVSEEQLQKLKDFLGEI